MKSIKLLVLIVFFSVSCSRHGIDKYCGEIAAIGVIFVKTSFDRYNDDDSSTSNDEKKYQSDMTNFSYWIFYNDCIEHSPSRIGGYD